MRSIHNTQFSTRDMKFTRDDGTSLLVSSSLWKLHSPFVSTFHTRWDALQEKTLLTHFPLETIQVADDLLFNLKLDCNLEIVINLLSMFDFYDIQMGREWIEKGFRYTISTKMENLSVLRLLHYMMSPRFDKHFPLLEMTQQEAWVRLTHIFPILSSSESHLPLIKALREIRPFSFETNGLFFAVVVTEFNNFILEEMFEKRIFPHSILFCNQFLEHYLDKGEDTMGTPLAFAFLRHLTSLPFFTSLLLMYNLSRFATQKMASSSESQNNLQQTRSFLKVFFTHAGILKHLENDNFLKLLPKDAEEMIKCLLFTFDIQTTPYMYQHASPKLFSKNRMERSASIISASLIKNPNPSAYNSECVKYYVSSRLQYRLNIGSCILAALSKYSTDALFDEIKSKTTAKKRTRALEALVGDGL